MLGGFGIVHLRFLSNWFQWSKQLPVLDMSGFNLSQFVQVGSALPVRVVACLLGV